MMRITRPHPKHFEIEMDGIRDDGTRGVWRVVVRFDDDLMPWFGIIIEPEPGSTSQNPEGYGGNVRAGECLAIVGLLLAAAADHIGDEALWSARTVIEGFRRAHGNARRVIEDLPLVQRIRDRIWAQLHAGDVQAAVRAANERLDRAEGTLADHVERLAKVFGVAEPASLVEIVRRAEQAAVLVFLCNGKSFRWMASHRPVSCDKCDALFKDGDAVRVDGQSLIHEVDCDYPTLGWAQRGLSGDTRNPPWSHEIELDTSEWTAGHEEYLASSAKACRCCRECSLEICHGVLAGGLCDMVCRCSERERDEDLPAEEDDISA